MLGFLDFVRMHSRMLRSGNIFRSHSFLILWFIKQIRDTVIINYHTSCFFVGFRRIKLTRDEFFSLFSFYYFALVCHIFCKLPICTMCFEYVMSASAMSMASQQNIKSHRMNETPITRPIVAAAASPPSPSPSPRLAATITTSQMNVFEAFHLVALKIWFDCALKVHSNIRLYNVQCFSFAFHRQTSFESSFWVVCHSSNEL